MGATYYTRTTLLHHGPSALRTVLRPHLGTTCRRRGVNHHSAPLVRIAGVARYALRRKAHRCVRGDYLVFRRGVACYARTSAQRAAVVVLITIAHLWCELRA